MSTRESPKYSVSSIKNSAGFKGFTLFASSQVSLYSFSNAGRRHRFPESDTKDIVTYSIAVSMSFMFPSVPLTPQIPQGLHGDGPTWMLHRQWFVSGLRNVSLET